MITQIQVTDSHFSCAYSIAKGQILSNSPLFLPWYGGEGGNIIVSLLTFSVVLWSYTHVVPSVSDTGIDQPQEFGLYEEIWQSIIS